MLDKDIVISNKYKILRKIATGGMADVFIAKDLGSDRKVAIKILHETAAANKNLVTKFKREAQILSKLDHPNIVSIYDWGRYKNSYYICIEYVEGIDLKELIEKKGPLDSKKAAGYALQICKALLLAHKNNLVHRDIKPQNILITKEGTLKVTDFGIAKSLVDDATKTLNIVGTANYISPEQAKGEKIDHKTDIYSLGILLYEMVTADVPFRGESTIDVTLKHINENPIEPSKLVESIPRQFERIILRCIEKDPEDRYQDIYGLQKDITYFLEGRKIKHSKKKQAVGSNSFMHNATAGTKITLLSLSGVFLVTSIIFLSLFLSYFFRYRDIEESFSRVEVPPLEAVSFSEAEKILSTYGLELKVGEVIQSRDFEDGTIIEQSPPSGSILDNDENTIVVTITEQILPEVKIDTPNLLGLSLEEAEEVLLEKGLEMGKVNETNSEFSNGTVLSQDPSYGTEVSNGDRINIEVSNGPEKISIPNIIGWDYYLASLHLNEIGLDVRYIRSTDLSVLPGTILEVYPRVGQQVEKEEEITLVISTTDELAIVPDLVYMELSTAISILESSQLRYEVTYVRSDYSFQKNTVISQIPESGSGISNDLSVLLFVGD